MRSWAGWAWPHTAYRGLVRNIPAKCMDADTLRRKDTNHGRAPHFVSTSCKALGALIQTSRSSGQVHISGKPGKTLYPGNREKPSTGQICFIRAVPAIRVAGQGRASGQPGNSAYPGSRETDSIRAKILYPGKKVQPGNHCIQAVELQVLLSAVACATRWLYPGRASKV